MQRPQCALIDNSISSRTIPLDLFSMIVKGYEETICHMQEIHDEQIQGLCLRSFIQESSFENEREQYIKVIEEYKGKLQRFEEVRQAFDDIHEGRSQL